jgi:hypothetical protein
MINRVLAIVCASMLFEYIRSVSDHFFDHGWSHGWEEGFACGISATPEDIEAVFPSADDDQQ